MHLSFTGSTPVADGDAQYAEVAGAGEMLLVSIRVLSTYMVGSRSCLRSEKTCLLAAVSRSMLKPETRFAIMTATGGIDVELAPQVVTALDDVCVLSPRSFDTPSLTALLGEVCLWLVEQRIGPRAQHAKYRSCDPYAQVRLFTGWHQPGRLFPCPVYDCCLRNYLTFSVLVLLLYAYLLANRFSTN